MLNYSHLSSYYQRSFYTNTQTNSIEIPLFQPSIIPDKLIDFKETTNSNNQQFISIETNNTNQITQNEEEEIPKKQTPVVISTEEDTLDDSSNDVLNINDLDDFERTFKIITRVIDETRMECSDTLSFDVTSTSSSAHCKQDESSDEFDNDFNDIYNEITNEINDIQNKKHSHLNSKRNSQKSHVIIQNGDPFELDKRRRLKNYKNWKRKRNKKQMKEPNKYVVELVKIGIGIIIIILCCCLVWKSHTEMLVM